MGWLILVAVLVGCGVAAGQADVARDEAWDAAFTRESGWNGGDIGHSIDLGDGRTLWLFGDSIVGPVRDGTRVAGESKFVRGAVGWHETPEDGAAPGETSFAIPEAFGDVPVVGWASPAPGLFGEDAWYWLMGDGEMVWDGAGHRRFVLFAGAIGPAGNPDGVWNFRQLGGAVLTVAAPEGAAERWDAVQRANRLVGAAARFGEEAVETDHWGLAVVAWPPGAEAGERTISIYGVRSAVPGDNRLVLARCAEDALDRPAEWVFFDGEGWAPERDAAATIVADAQTEFTVERVRLPDAMGVGREVLVMVQSEPMLGRHIWVRTATAPEGPWSAPVSVFEVPEPGEDERLLVYAAKGHADLSRPGELLVSYVINSTDFGQIFRDASLYRPRFVRVPLEMLPEPPG